MEEQNKKKEKVKPFIDAVKFFYALILTLAAQNLISEFSKAKAPDSDLVFSQSFENWFVLFCGITIILRFYFGNISHINSDKDFDGFEILVDCLTIIIQGIGLAYATFFFNHPDKFFAVIVWVFLTDIFWYVVRAVYVLGARKSSDLNSRINSSEVVTAVTIMLFIIFSWDSTVQGGLIDKLLDALLKAGRVEVDHIIWIFALNTIADIVVNGPRYVGLQWGLRENTSA